MSENFWKLMKENKFEFANEISNDLICNICKKLMVKACNAPCGCRFCSDCIESYLSGNDKFCPGTKKYCQKKTINYSKDIVIDNHANIQISETIVKCPMQNCEFKDELGLIENHMQSCINQPISCPFNAIGCAKEIVNNKMIDHLNENNFCHSKLLIELINDLRIQIKSITNENQSLRNSMKESVKLINEMEQEIKIIETRSQQQINDLKQHYEQKGQQIESPAEIEISASLIRDIETNYQREIDKLKQNYEQLQKEDNKQMEILKRKIDEISEENEKGSTRLSRHDETFNLIIKKKISNLEVKMSKLNPSIRF